MFEFGAMADRSRSGGGERNGGGDSSLGRQDPNRRVRGLGLGLARRRRPGREGAVCGVGGD